LIHVFAKRTPLPSYRQPAVSRRPTDLKTRASYGASFVTHGSPISPERRGLRQARPRPAINAHVLVLAKRTDASIGPPLVLRKKPGVTLTTWSANQAGQNMKPRRHRKRLVERTTKRSGRRHQERWLAPLRTTKPGRTPKGLVLRALSACLMSCYLPNMTAPTPF
jgi:hypothetical protein